MLAPSDATLCFVNSELLLTTSVEPQKASFPADNIALSRADDPREYSQEAKFFMSNSRWPTHSVLFLIGPLFFNLSLDAITFNWALSKELQATSHTGIQ